MTGPAKPPTKPGDGPWVERWLSPERFATYLLEANGDRVKALELYEWNARVSASLLHDLGHLEIGLRNAYDRALSTSATVPWTDPASPMFAPLLQTRRGRPVDLNERFRQQIVEAERQAQTATNRMPAHCDVVAQLGFGFWRYLSSKAHEKTLWVPHLHRSFPKGTNRHRDVDEPIVRLNRIRNRVAHHEPLLNVGLMQRVTDAIALATLIDPDLSAHIAAFSTVGQHVARRP